MSDYISRQAAIDALDKRFDSIPIEQTTEILLLRKDLKDLPPAQPERLTDDDFETIRIHLNAYKEELCNQRRWKEAGEYQRIIERFMAFASAQPEPLTDKERGWNAGAKAAREETWDIAKRIVCSEANGGLSADELMDIFGWRTPSLILLKFTAEEAAEKIHEWEMRKAEANDRHEIERGDEVIAVFGKAVVTKVNAENVEYVYGNGMSGKDRKTNVRWTGKNYCAMGQIMDKLLEE